MLLFWLLLLLVLLPLRLLAGLLEGGGVNAFASLSRPDVIASPALDVSPCASSYFVVVAEVAKQGNEKQGHDSWVCKACEITNSIQRKKPVKAGDGVRSKNAGVSHSRTTACAGNRPICFQPSACALV